jgi:enolase
VNQIMINAVELQLIEDEVKALRLEKEVLKIKLAEAERNQNTQGGSAMGTQRIHTEVTELAKMAGVEGSPGQLREFARMVSQNEREVCIQAIREVRETYNADPAEKDVQVALDWASSKITARGVRWEVV